MKNKQLELHIGQLKQEFGKIVILEGDNNTFNEYNTLANTFKEIYKGENIIGYGGLYNKSKEEIINLFTRLFSDKEPTSLILHTTGTRSKELSDLKKIAKRVYSSLDDFGIKHNIKYLIEQYEHKHFSSVAEELKINYISNLDFWFDMDKDDILKIDYIDNKGLEMKKTYKSIRLKDKVLINKILNELDVRPYCYVYGTKIELRHLNVVFYERNLGRYSHLESFLSKLKVIKPDITIMRDI